MIILPYYRVLKEYLEQKLPGGVKKISLYPNREYKSDGNWNVAPRDLPQLLVEFGEIRFEKHPVRSLGHSALILHLLEPSYDENVRAPTLVPYSLADRVCAALSSFAFMAVKASGERIDYKGALVLTSISTQGFHENFMRCSLHFKTALLLGDALIKEGLSIGFKGAGDGKKLKVSHQIHAEGI